MIDLYKPDICIYHGDCLDGFGAAWAIHLKWPDCDFRPGWYGKPLPTDGIDGKHVLFVDFSAPELQLLEIGHRAASVVVLDHHKTAEADLARFAQNKRDIENCAAHLAERRTAGLVPIVAYFDMDRSGAMMAWDLVSDGGFYRLPDLLMYIGDRDLWNFHFSDMTRAVCAALQTYPMDFDVWDGWRWNVEPLDVEGRGVLRANRMSIEKLLKEVRFQTVGGNPTPVPTVNAPYQFASDAGHAMLEKFPDAPFAAAFFVRADGYIQWSLRSETHREDVSAIAKANGGGGHRNAAGFTQQTVLMGWDLGREV